MNHLENTGSALAEDVIQKSEIIKSYFMETKAGKNRWHCLNVCVSVVQVNSCTCIHVYMLV